MPFGDGTGPRGEGPRTGRGFGYCSGFGAPGYTKGRGFGRGPGRGFGYGSGFGRSYGPMKPNIRVNQSSYGLGARNQEEARESEKEYLANQIEALEEELQAMKNRMKKLNNQSEDRE